MYPAMGSSILLNSEITLPASRSYIAPQVVVEELMERRSAKMGSTEGTNVPSAKVVTISRDFLKVPLSSQRNVSSH